MIEKRAAVENLEAILKVPGIDMIQFGPADYGLSVGKASRDYATGLHPEMLEAREYTIKTAIKMGVRPRAEINNAAEAESYLNLGVKDFNLSTDVSILRQFYSKQDCPPRDRRQGQGAGQRVAARQPIRWPPDASKVEGIPFHPAL
jgi:2-keto-3-deoxy-L-rhamnonate aldolase RhmA